MKLSDFEDMDYFIGGGPYQNMRFSVDYDHFEEWLRSKWDVKLWRYLDWKMTRLPMYQFEFYQPVEDGIVEIYGELYDNEFKRIILEPTSPQFGAWFIKKLVNEFPENKDVKALIKGAVDVVFNNAYSEDEILAMTEDEIYAKVLREPTPDYQRALTAFP